MNNIDLILDSIKEDAQKEKDAILSKAKTESQEIVKRKEAEAESQASEMVSEARDQAELLIKNSEITAHRQARDIKISAQNDVVASVLKSLEDELIKISDEDYKKYVLNSLKNMNVKNAEILLQKGKENLFTENELNGLKISNDTVEEGFVVKSGKIEYDSRFSSLIEFKRDELERLVIEEIFK